MTFKMHYFDFSKLKKNSSIWFMTADDYVLM